MNESSNLAMALSKAQGVMGGAKKSSTNPFFKSSYADLSSVFDAIREPFSEFGLSVTQTIDVLDNGKQILCTRLMHVGGEFIDSKMLLPIELNPQKLGSLITYYRRYSLMAICGIAAEDDDGNQAVSPVEHKAGSVSQNADDETLKIESISDEQYKEIEEALGSNLALRMNILAFMKRKWNLEKLHEMPTKIYEHSLNRAKQQQKFSEQSLGESQQMEA